MVPGVRADGGQDAFEGGRGIGGKPGKDDLGFIDTVVFAVSYARGERSPAAPR